MKKAKLLELLMRAYVECDKNISNAHNIDLEDMSQVLEGMIDNLNDIEDFEVYEED